MNGVRGFKLEWMKREATLNTYLHSTVQKKTGYFFLLCNDSV